MKNKKNRGFMVLTLGALISLSSCVGGGGTKLAPDGTSNTLFFYPVNYFGIKDKAFTSRWLGMKKALTEYGWTITGDGQKDSKKFKASRNEDSVTPKDTKIIFVNNQTWDTGLALTDPLAEHKPLAVISTSNGVEFVGQRIVSDSPNTHNVTMGGFGPLYEAAFKNGTLRYLASKMSASVAGIVALTAAAVNGNVIRNDEGHAVNIPQEFWFVDSLEKYEEMGSVDIISGTNPVYKKADFDPHMTDYASFSSFIKDTASFDDLKAHFNANRNTPDPVASTAKFKMGLLVPSSINESIERYLEFIEGYLAKVYNYETTRFAVSATVNQVQQTTAAANAGMDAVISLQDDGDRENSIVEANRRGIYYGIGGVGQGPLEYTNTKELEYFLGSIGTSLDDEENAGYMMSKAYLQKIVDRGAIV